MVGNEASLSELPEGWTVLPLSEIADKIVDGSHNPPPKQDSGRPMLSARNIENNRIVFDEFRLLSEEAFEAENRRTQVSPGDVLLTIVGTVGRAAVVPENYEPFTLQRSVAVLSPSVTTSKFLMYQLQSPNAQTFFKENARGTAQKGIYLRALGQMEIFVPPLSEQNRIVSRLEELLSELDKGVEYLKIAQKQLKVYRQSVLKAAFEGRLTEEWRKAHADQSETADQLLERIYQERENRYQQQLNEWEEAVKTWEENGKDGKKPTKPPMLSEIVSLSEEELLQLPQLPEDWRWTRIGSLGKVQLGRQRSPQNRSRDYPTKYLRAANITEDGLDLTDVMDMDFKPHELERYQLKYGDILLSEASGSADQAGKPALWRDQIPKCCFQNTVIRFQPICLSSEYMLNVFKHFYFNKVFSKVASGVGINHLSASKFSALPVPLPPLKEQQNITQLVELNLSIYNQLDTVINRTLQKSIVLYSSILKKAFLGQLVTQDFNDEHAAVLLERIREIRRYQEENQVSMPKPRKQVAMKKDLSIIEVLQELNGMATSQDVWRRSKHQEDIEGFYAELKKQVNNGIVEEVEELREEKKSYLRLRNEN
jgi:type I restriction enzyme, S subunit